MKGGDILLASLPQSDGAFKKRPVLFLCRMPPFGDFLVRGISTQLQHEVPGFDDVISADTPDFSETGLKSDSLIRVGFLAVLPETEFKGRIGSISTERKNEILIRLSKFLNPDFQPDG